MKRKLKDFIIDPRGQYNHPGKKTYIPNAKGSITMRGVPYPVLGIDDQGNQQMMYPNQEYQFPGNSVYEIPMVQFGGTFNPDTDEFIEFTDELSNLQKGGWIESITSAINPYNWGVEDYSNQKTFNEAYSSAKKAGNEEFLYNNKRYNTKYAGTPRQEVGRYGINGKPINTKYINDPAEVYLYPAFGRYLPGHVSASIAENQTSVDYSSRGNYPYGVRDSYKRKNEKTYNVYGQNNLTFSNKAASLPTGNYFIEEEYTPSDWNLFTNNCADNVCDAFGIPRDKGLMYPSDAVESIKRKYPTIDITGRTYDDYNNLYENLQIQPNKKILSQANNILGIASSPENQKSDLGKLFISTIQGALANEGYDLSKSLKQAGNYDGVYGPETKKALADWKKKNKNKKQEGGTFNPDTDEFIGFADELPKAQEGLEKKQIIGTNRKVTPEGVQYPLGPDGKTIIANIRPGVEIVDNMPDNLRRYGTILPTGLSENEEEDLYYNFQKQYGYRSPSKSDSYRDTVIDLTNQTMGWFPFNAIPSEQYSSILGNNYVERKTQNTGNPEDYAKNWITRMSNPEDTFRNKDYAEEAGSYYRSKDIPAFYGIEGGKFKVGNPKDFSENTLIVPVRNSTTPYAKIEKENGILNNHTYTYDKSGNKIWNLNYKDKFIVYSPKTKKAIFRSQQEKGSVAESKKILEDFSKNNPDAYIIPIDEGRFKSYLTSSKGLSEGDIKNWNAKAGTILENYLVQEPQNPNIPINSPSGTGYGYNFGIIKQTGGTIQKAQRGTQVRKPIYTTNFNDPRIQMYNDSLSLHLKGLVEEKKYKDFIDKAGFDNKNLGTWGTDGYIDDTYHKSIGPVEYGILKNHGGGFYRDSNNNPIDFTTYTLKNGRDLQIEDNSKAGRMLRNRYPIFKKPIQPILYKEKSKSLPLKNSETSIINRTPIQIDRLESKKITSIPIEETPMELSKRGTGEPFKPSKVLLREMGNISRYNNSEDGIIKEPYKNSHEVYMDDKKGWRKVSPEDYEMYKKQYPGSDTPSGWIMNNKQIGGSLQKYQIGSEFIGEKFIPMDIPDQEYYPDTSEGTINIRDNRVWNPVTNSRIVPTRDLKGGRYSKNIIRSMAEAAYRNNMEDDTYVGLGMGLQETNLGKTDPNIGHVLDVKSYPNQTPQDDLFRALKEKYEVADKLGYRNNPLQRLQTYNGNYLTRDTEKDYHKGQSQAFYGVPVPDEGLNLRKNPLYAKKIFNLRDSVLLQNPELVDFVNKATNDYANRYSIDKAREVASKIDMSNPNQVNAAIVNFAKTNPREYARIRDIYFKNKKQTGGSLEEYQIGGDTLSPYRPLSIPMEEYNWTDRSTNNTPQPTKKPTYKSKSKEKTQTQYKPTINNDYSEPRYVTERSTTATRFTPATSTKKEREGIPDYLSKEARAIKLGLDLGQFTPAAPFAYLASLPFTTYDVAKNLYNGKYTKAGVDAFGFIPGANATRLARNAMNSIDVTNDLDLDLKNGGTLEQYQKKGQVKPRYLSPEQLGIRQVMQPSTTSVAPIAPKLQASQYYAQAQNDVNNVKLTDDDFREKYGTNKHTWQMKTNPQYKAQVEAEAIELAKRNGTIDLPSSNMFSKSYTGNPNLNYMVPNGLTGDARRSYEESQMNMVGTVLPIPGLQQVGKIPSVFGAVGKTLDKFGNIITTQTPLRNAYKLNPWSFQNTVNEMKPSSEFAYRTLGRQEGFENTLNSGLITPKPGGAYDTQHGAAFYNAGYPLLRYSDDLTYVNGKFIVKDGPKYIAEVPLSNSKVVTRYADKPDKYRITKGTNEGGLGHVGINEPGVTIYKEDWLRGYKPVEVPKSTSSFKSEINWNKWNPEITSNQTLLNEYNTIEETSKANGSWMKNPDGSLFQGTPEQFVQQQSQNFKNAFGNSKLINPDGSPTIQYHGSAKKFDTFDESKFQLGDSGYSGKGIYTSPSKTTADSYTLSSAKFHKGDIEPTIYELYGQANNPISSSQLINENKGRDLFNFHRDRNWKGELSPYESLREYDAAISDQLTGVQNIRPWYDAREVVFPTNKQIKSAIGNNGMFDMTNPNIYKSILSAIGTGALGIGTRKLQNKKKGGTFNPNTDEFLSFVD